MYLTFANYVPPFRSARPEAAASRNGTLTEPGTAGSESSPAAPGRPRIPHRLKRKAFGGVPGEVARVKIYPAKKEAPSSRRRNTENIAFFIGVVWIIGNGRGSGRSGSPHQNQLKLRNTSGTRTMKRPAAASCRALHARGCGSATRTHFRPSADSAAWARPSPSAFRIGGTSNFMMTRVTSPGCILTVSFQPSSVASGGRAGPVVREGPAGITRCVEGIPVENLDVHQMEMDRVRVAGEIADFPDFHVAVVGVSVAVIQVSPPEPSRRPAVSVPSNWVSRP